MNQEKKILRYIMNRKLLTLKPKERHILSEALCSNLEVSEYIKKAEILLAYSPMREEADIMPLIETALTYGKRAAFPRICGSEIRFHFIEKITGPWEIHPYGIKEPITSLPVFTKEFIKTSGNVLALVPGLAFDLIGRRLGHGKGFYDRFLSGTGSAIISIGVGFSFQVLNALPFQKWDYPMDAVCTDQGLNSMV